MATRDKTRKPSAKRRKKGTGSLRPHGRGWEAEIKVRDPETGVAKRLREWRATESEAEEWLAEQTRKVKRGYARELSGIPFSQLADKYLERRRLKVKGGEIGQGQFDNDDSRIHNHLLPHFGTRPINEIDADAIETYRDLKLAGEAPVRTDSDGTPLAASKLAPQTVLHHLATLRGMFKLARRLKWLSEDPTDFVDNPEINRPKAEALQPVEVERLLSQIQTAKRPLTLVALYLGMRSGEARGIRIHEDIDFKDDLSGVVHVRGAIKRLPVEGSTNKKLVWVGRPKSKAGWRDIPFGPAFGAFLKELIEVSERLPDPDNLGLLFRTSNGNPVSSNNYTNQVYFPAASAALFKLMRPHQQARLLAALPVEFQLPTQLLALDDVSVESALTATWDDYDSDSRIFRYEDADGEQREVVLPEALDAELTVHRQAQLEAGTPNKRNYIFPGKRSSRIRLIDFTSAVFREGWSDANLDADRRLHRLRHTYASVMAQRVPIEVLSKYIGHGRISTTTDIYVHFYGPEHTGDTMDHYK